MIWAKYHDSLDQYPDLFRDRNTYHVRAIYLLRKMFAGKKSIPMIYTDTLKLGNERVTLKLYKPRACCGFRYVDDYHNIIVS